MLHIKYGFDEATYQISKAQPSSFTQEVCPRMSLSKISNPLGGAIFYPRAIM